MDNRRREEFPAIFYIWTETRKGWEKGLGKHGRVQRLGVGGEGCDDTWRIPDNPREIEPEIQVLTGIWMTFVDKVDTRIFIEGPNWR